MMLCLQTGISPPKLATRTGVHTPVLKQHTPSEASARIFARGPKHPRGLRCRVYAARTEIPIA